MQIVSLSFVAFMLVFVVRIVLELRRATRWIRFGVVCLLPILFVVGTLEWNAYHTAYDSKSGSQLDAALSSLVVGLEDGKEADVLSAVQEVRRTAAADVHELADVLHERLREQVVDGAKSSRQ